MERAQPLEVAATGGLQGHRSEITSAIEVRSRTSAMSSSRIRPAMRPPHSPLRRRTSCPDRPITPARGTPVWRASRCPPTGGSGARRNGYRTGTMTRCAEVQGRRPPPCRTMVWRRLGCGYAIQAPAVRDEAGQRHATWLELFLDLIFVYALAAVVAPAGRQNRRPSPRAVSGRDRALRQCSSGPGGAGLLRHPVRSGRRAAPAAGAGRVGRRGRDDARGRRGPGERAPAGRVPDRAGRAAPAYLRARPTSPRARW